jgi:hypothetical protein
MFCVFEAGRLVEITIPDYCDYRGFKVRQGEIAFGISITDTRKSVLGRLGRPDDTDADPIASNVNRDEPTGSPSSTTYT